MIGTAHREHRQGPALCLTLKREWRGNVVHKNGKVDIIYLNGVRRSAPCAHLLYADNSIACLVVDESSAVAMALEMVAIPAFFSITLAHPTPTYQSTINTEAGIGVVMGDRTYGNRKGTNR